MSEDRVNPEPDELKDQELKNVDGGAGERLEPKRPDGQLSKPGAPADHQGLKGEV
jgi:hypothetical protein